MRKRTFGFLSALLLGLGLSVGLTVDASAAGLQSARPPRRAMPVAQQNKLVQQVPACPATTMRR